MSDSRKGRWAIRGEQRDGSAFWLKYFRTHEAAMAELACIEPEFELPLWVEDTQKRFQVFVVENGEHAVCDTYHSPTEADRAVVALGYTGAEAYAVDSKTGKRVGVHVMPGASYGGAKKRGVR